MAAYIDSLDKRMGVDEICDAAVVTSDGSDTTTVLNATMNNKAAQRLWVGTSGDVVIVLESNTAANDGAAAGSNGKITLKNVIAGNWVKIPPTKRIAKTGTTAVNVVIGVLF